MKLVIIDGMSGSGKDTLQKEIIKKFNYDILTINRFTPSIWVYDALRKKDSTKEVQEYEIMFDKDIRPFVFVCFCDPKVASIRDFYKENVFTYEQEGKFFNQYFSTISKYSNLHYIDTTEFSAEHIANDIERIIK